MADRYCGAFPIADLSMIGTDFDVANALLDEDRDSMSISLITATVPS